MKTTPFVIERTFAVPVEKVWKAITDPDDMRQWYFDLEDFKAEPGFSFAFDAGEEGKKFRHICKVTEAVVNRKLVYTWRYDGYPGNSLVIFELFEEGEKTRLKLTHEGLETFPPFREFKKESFMNGWTSLIGEQLKGFLENSGVRAE